MMATTTDARDLIALQLSRTTAHDFTAARSIADDILNELAGADINLVRVNVPLPPILCST